MKKALLLSLIFGLFLSCTPDSLPIDEQNQTEEIAEESVDLSDVEFPADFDFGTTSLVTLLIQDSDPEAHYNIYLYNVDLLNPAQYAQANEEVKTNREKVGLDGITLLDEIYSGSSKDGVLEIKAEVPAYTERLYIRRRVGKSYQGTFVRVEQSVVNLSSTSFDKDFSSKSTGQNEYLVAVNGLAEVYLISPSTGETVLVDILPEGTHAVAYDDKDQVIYAIGEESFFELLRRFDLATGEWDDVGNAGSGQAHRMTMSPDHSSLYVSTDDRIRVLDISTAQQTAALMVKGVANTEGGDLAFGADENLYCSSPSGVYHLNRDGSNYVGSKINTTDLPFVPTGIAFDNDGMLWIANDEVNASLVRMDVTTGDWEYMWNNLEFAVTDLTYGDWSTGINYEDTDGDGVVDVQDEFPEDPSLAYRQFIPSEHVWMTFLVEDLWPFLGDYDFNDTVIEYRYEYYLNADNELVQATVHYRVVNDGAGMTNGFGLAFRELSPNDVAQVNGSRMYHDYVNLASNGTEENQTNAIVILTDDHSRDGHKIEQLEIDFTTPLAASIYQNLSVDPFLIVNKERGREIHLPFKQTTDLGDPQFEKDAVTGDADGNFKTENGLPWALLIQGSVYVPREKVGIEYVYNYFQLWAMSGGQNYEDWYLDIPGHINKDKIK